MKIISLFNHKGGVSKTTTTFNLGWKLADLGYKTLIVDADPQCNLTSLVLDYDSIDNISLGERVIDLEKMREKYTSGLFLKQVLFNVDFVYQEWLSVLKVY